MPKASRLAALLLGALALAVANLACNQQSSTHNPPSLWVGFGQTEVELVLVESQPPYY